MKHHFMKTKTFLILFILVSIINNSYSQSFTYKKTFFTSQEPALKDFVKMKGEIYICDTLITLITDATNYSAKQKADYPISISSKKEKFMQARAVLESKEFDIRFTFQENFYDNKKEKFTLNMEIKDNFKNTTVSTIYYLIPKGENE